MTSPRFVAAIAFMIPALGSCGEAVAPGTTVTDSAGIAIVENPAAEAADTECFVSPEPFFEVGGGVEAEVPLLRVTAVEPQDDAPDVLRPTQRMPGRSWMIFDSTGAFQATIQTEEGFEPYLVRQDALWGVFVDELDIESVRAYRLDRR